MSFGSEVNVGHPPRTAVLDGFKYAKSHEWAHSDGSVATVGISDHAQVSRSRGTLGWVLEGTLDCFSVQQHHVTCVSPASPSEA